VKLALVMRYGGDERLAYPTLVAPQALKKYVTGKGAGDKAIIIKKAYQKWGVDIDDDNMVDAYALARLGEALLCGSKHNYEHEVVNSLERNTEWARKP
jgi:hypothetical protein